MCAIYSSFHLLTSLSYLGVHINNKLDWSDNSIVLYKKGQHRLFLFRRLKSYGVKRALLLLFGGDISRLL